MFAEGPEWQPESEADLCESCGQGPASVHVVRVEAGDISQAHLCQECAGEMAQQSGGPALVFALPLAVGAVESKDRPRSIQPLEARPDMVCAVCGTTFTDLTETGLAGCASCYEVFAEQLTRPMRLSGDDQGPVRHAGKMPRQAAGGLQERREVVRLTRMLRELVETERFEEAAGVRDRLLELGYDPGRSPR